MTDTARTVRIIEVAPIDDVQVVLYWINLSDADKALFDNISDFLTALKTRNK